MHIDAGWYLCAHILADTVLLDTFDQATAYRQHAVSADKMRHLCNTISRKCERVPYILQAAMMFLWAIEIAGVALLLEEFILKLTDVSLSCACSSGEKS